MDGYILNNLENYLIQNGVTDNHIEKIKEEKTISFEELKLYYDVKKGQKISYVPVHLIKATSGGRGAVNETWFNIAESRINIDSGRLERCLGFLKSNKDLKSYFNFFESDQCLNAEKIAYEFYNMHGIYKVGTGNHRTIAAKLTGARFIKASVDFFEFNQIKYDKYLSLKEAFAKFESVLKKLNLTGRSYSFSKCSSDAYIIFYKGEKIISSTKKSFLYYYIEFKNKRYNVLTSIVKDELKLKQITKILSELETLLEKIMRKSSFYKNIFNVSKKLRIIHKLPFVIHYFHSRQDEFIANSSLLIAAIDCNMKINNDFVNYLTRKWYVS